MKFGAALGWGIAIYAIMFLAWNGLVLYGFAQGIGPRLVAVLVLAVVATIAGRSLRYSRAKDIIPYLFTWTVMVALLDAVFSVPYSGWQMYADWNVWVGYALVCLIPLLAPYTRPHRSSTEI